MLYLKYAERFDTSCQSQRINAAELSKKYDERFDTSCQSKWSQRVIAAELTNSY